MDTRLRKLERRIFEGDYEAYKQLCNLKDKLGEPEIWTQFSDAHTMGYKKTPYEDIYIEAPKEIAEEIYKERFGKSVWSMWCECCGHGYSINEYDSLEQATAYDRNCLFHEGLERWLEEPKHPNARYRDDQHKTVEEYALRPDILIITKYDFTLPEALISLRSESI